MILPERAVSGWDSAAADDLWTEACGKDRWLGTTETLDQDIRCVSDARLWQFRTTTSQSLVEYACKRLSLQLATSGTSPEAVDEAQELICTSNREQLGLILLSNTELFRKVIQDGLSDATKPKDRLAIYLKLIDLVDKLSNTLQLEDQVEKEAHEFLKHGPQLIMAKSRFTATERTVTIESEG